jgi:hypothetical protein
MSKRTTSLLAALAAAVLLGGCAPSVTSTRAPVGGREVSSPPLPISNAELESKVARLAKRLEQTRMEEKEKQVAMELLNSYQIIGATLQPPMTEGDRQRVIRLLFESLTKLDEQYFQKGETGQLPVTRSYDQYSSLRKEILHDYLASDHEKVVNKCIGLQASFGEESLAPEVGILFSISLSKQGRLREAVAAGEKVLREIDRNPDRVNLRAYILEWQLAMGQERSAQESLKDLVQRVAEKEVLLRQVRQKTGTSEKIEPPTSAPGEVPLPAAEMTAEEPATVGSGSLAKSLDEAKELIQKKEYTKAKFILLQQRIRFPEGPETESIDQMMQAVEAAEGEKGEEEPAARRATVDTERITIAKRLIEEENYDEALAKLNEIQQEGNSPADVTALKEVATEKLINRERNKAAKLFLMARSETDAGKKEELLSNSMNILKGLLEKYPTSPLKKKISENMTTIRDEMNRMKKKAE